MAIDGTTVLNNYDIVADAGNLVGTMKAFNVTSDGNIDIDFSHVDREPAHQRHRDHQHRRGAVAAARCDQPFASAHVRRLDGRDDLEPEHAIGGLEHDPGDLRPPGQALHRLDGWDVLRPLVRRDERRRRAGDQPERTDGLPGAGLSGMFFLDGQLYFTVRGTSQMYHRCFTPESQIVGSFRYTVNAPSVDFSTVRGITSPTDTCTTRGRTATSTRWTSPTGCRTAIEVLVSPKSAGYDWSSNGLFIFTHVAVDTDPPTAPGKPTGSSPGTGTITLNWAASTDASPPITYKVYRDGDLVNAVGTTTSTTFTDTNLTPGSQHTYAIEGDRQAGQRARPSVRPRIRSR